MKNPQVSIVCITYNHEEYIRSALESFVTQEADFPFEAIVADDRSTDGTAKIIQEYADKYPDIIKPILRTKNIGAIENFLSAIRKATGKYVAICDGDDYWTDTLKLKKQVEFLNSNPDYAICFHPVRVVFEKNEQKESAWPDITNTSKITVNELLRENFIPTNAVMYRRQNYEKIPGDIMPLDWYLHAFHAQYGKIGFINKTMSTYRRHEGSIWWDSHANKDKLWLTQGLAHFRLYTELLKLYGKDEEKRAIIYAGLNGALANLVSADIRYDEHLVRSALDKFPDAIEPFAYGLYQDNKQKNQLIEQTSQANEELTLNIMELREQVFKLRDELHVMKNSRVLGKIIKARESIGAAIPRVKHLPLNAPRRLKVVFAESLPEGPRRTLRNTRKILRDTRQNIIEKRAHKNFEYRIVSNERIKANLPLVSVVIPYFNLADTIDDALDSLEAQTFKNFETIIVNDGSSEEASIKKLEQIKKSRPAVRIINQENQGVAGARNTGAAEAQGRYVICLDADDVLDITYVEKCTMVLECTPDVSIVTTQMRVFGVLNEPFRHAAYDPIKLYSDNMVITAAEFRKNAWEVSGGYKSKIGYEDWEHWLNLAEHGFFGKSLPEPLFIYRTAMESRYVGDKDVHWSNVKAIRSLHPHYKKIVKKVMGEREAVKELVEPAAAFINMNDATQFLPADTNRSNILVTIPWMTFGGAETLIYNYCREIKDKFNISFATGLKSEHEWEYKFREITPNIYHMASLFDDPKLYLEFISNYITTRNIDVLHAVHNGFTFAMMPELRKRHPKLKIILTLFNDRVPEYVQGAVECQSYIDRYVTDNEAVARSLEAKSVPGADITVIPNGIDVYDEFSAKLFDRDKERTGLSIDEKDTAVFFVGRLSEEKNPDVFVRAAKAIAGSAKYSNVKFFIIGDGPMRADVERQIKEARITNIKYLGYQPVTEVARYLSTADIFVLPSKVEGFPLSLLEAMAMGVAVIASDVGAVAEVVDSGVNGYVVKPGSVEEITGSIKLLADDEVKLTDIKKKAHTTVEKKYSNRVLGSNYTKLYEEVAE
jgi:glycosyltransferase involved in cell wall biosynthesis